MISRTPERKQRCQKETSIPKNTASTGKHAGGSVLLWGCFAALGTGSLIQGHGVFKEKANYADTLRDNLKNSALSLVLGHRLVLQQDNDLKQGQGHQEPGVSCAEARLQSYWESVEGAQSKWSCSENTQFRPAGTICIRWLGQNPSRDMWVVLLMNKNTLRGRCQLWPRISSRQTINGQGTNHFGWYFCLLLFISVHQ